MNFKKLYIFIFSLFLIPLNCFAADYHINSIKKPNYSDDDLIQIVSNVINYDYGNGFTPHYIIFSSMYKEYLYVSDSEPYGWVADLEWDNNSKYIVSLDGLNVKTFNAYPYSSPVNFDFTSSYLLLWTDSDLKKYNTSFGHRFIINPGFTNSDYYTFGNLNYAFTSELKYESLFYRHFGFYDLSSIDNEPPVLTLNGSSDLNVEINSIFNEPGYSCIDNSDSDCSVSVSSDLDISKLGDYQITYVATDESGNKSNPVIRNIKVVDTTAPNLSLIGDDVLYLTLDSEYEEFGYYVSDNSKEEIEVIIDSSSIDTSISSTYEVTYFACDSSENCSSLKRLVKVHSVLPLDFSGSQYLFFDFSDIQLMFPNINFSGINNTEVFTIVILFNIFFAIFLFLILWLLIKSIYKVLSIVW